MKDSYITRKIRTKLLISSILGSLILFSGNSVAQTGYDSYWDKGFKFESADKNFSFKFGGRIMYDMILVKQDAALDTNFGPFSTGTEFRRVRLFNSGKIYKNVNYILDLAFEGQEVEFKDVFLEFTSVPGVGNIRLGIFKEPNVLEELTSSKYITFMERSFVSDMNPTRNSGIMLHKDYYGNRLAWQAAYLNPVNGESNSTEIFNSYILLGRVSGLPLYDEAGEKIVHLGGYYRYEIPQDGRYSYDSRPSTNQGKKYINTGVLNNINSAATYGGEFSVILGPLNVQAEFARTDLDDAVANDPSVTAYYGQVSYFLTGESRKYKNSFKGFDRVKPKKNLGEDGGFGALQAAVRYGAVTLENTPSTGETLSTITGGLNWYLNPATRIVLNYVYGDLKEIGSANILQARFQVDF